MNSIIEPATPRQQRPKSFISTWTRIALIAIIGAVLALSACATARPRPEAPPDASIEATCPRGTLWLDRYEGSMAVLVDAAGHQWDVPPTALPVGATPGDALARGRLMPACTASLLSDIERLRARLLTLPESR